MALAEEFPHVYAAVGVHPSDCGEWGEGTLLELRQLASRPKVRAIGEIGLDYYWKDNPPRALQQNVFHRQLELAQSLRLPVIVHDREAHQDCLSIVREHPQVTGVYHCYSGSLEDAKVLVKLGWMLSFTGVITYKNARKALEVIDWLPMDRIMIETDSPYLTPSPFGQAERLRLCPSGGRDHRPGEGGPPGGGRCGDAGKWPAVFWHFLR